MCLHLVLDNLKAGFHLRMSIRSLGRRSKSAVLCGKSERNSKYLDIWRAIFSKCMATEKGSLTKATCVRQVLCLECYANMRVQNTGQYIHRYFAFYLSHNPKGTPI